MLKMIFLFIFSVILFPIFNCKPITVSSQKLFDESNCTIPLSILGSKFKETNNTSSNSFLVPLEACKTVKNDHILFKLCEELFAVLYNISTCNAELVPDRNLDYEINNTTEISDDICNDFQNQSFVGDDDSRNIGSGLKIKIVCDLFCEGEKIRICDVLLWGYKVQRILHGEPADSKNKMLEKTTSSAINKSPQSLFVTPFSIHPPLVTGANFNITQTDSSPIVEGIKVDSLNTEISEEVKLSTRKQKVLKLDSKDQSKIQETSTFKTVDGKIKNNFVQKINASKNEIKKFDKLESTVATDSLNTNKLKNILLLDNPKIHASNYSVDSKLSDPASKLNQSNFIDKDIPNDDEDSNTEIQNLSENGGDDYSISNILPQKEGQDSEMANQKNSEKFRIVTEKFSLKIGNQEKNKFTSNMENKPSQGNSTNFVKTSNATLLVAELDIKAQEYESNDQFSTNAVQPTHQELASDELPSAAEEPSDLATDEASKGLTENEKSTLNQPMFNDPDYEFPSDGGSETQRFDIPASKFQEGTFLSGNQNIFPEQEDTHFFFYFLSIILIVITCYLVFHNKQKIIALIVEGCHERRRRPHGVNYRKLETK